jgi:alkanesulfonate monooxygenase SsuD/methylene tetrahydromethanopterin reductase-like flavin-dependent oxidoreductase (luciferase family)
MIEVWTSASASFDGRYYSCRDIVVKPSCVRRPHVPIWVGGSTRPALRRVAEFGDVWHPMGWEIFDATDKAAAAGELSGKTLPQGGTTPDRLRRDLAYARRLADDAGRDLSRLEVVVLPGTPGGESVATLVREGPREPQSAERDLDWLGRYLDAGATGFAVFPHGASLEECAEYLRWHAAEVMAPLRPQPLRVAE